MIRARIAHDAFVDLTSPPGTRLSGGSTAAEAQFSEAAALLAQGRLDAAIERLSALLVLEPDFAKASFTLGQALWLQGKHAAAAERLRHGLRLMPQLAEGHNNLGLLYIALRDYDAAVQSFGAALAVKPDLAWAHCNLGNALQAQGKLDDAIESYRRALAIDPRHAESYVNLANVLKDRGDLDAAVASYRMALSLRPDDAQAWVNLGSALQAQGELDAAIESFRHALSRDPEHADARSGVIFTLNIHPAASPAECLAEARRYGSMSMARARPFAHPQPDAKDRSANRSSPLRVGLVSGDLRAHPVGYFVESVLGHLDPARFEFLAYPTSLREDELSARIRPRFAAWRSIVDSSDEAAANAIHADGVDILVDLSGHTAHNRLPVFAWKPAPLQLTWLGYFATTGVPAIDYLLADRVSVPEAQRDRFTETVWYLPDGRMCFTPPAANEKFLSTPLPALRRGGVTFGCFQNLLKVNDVVLAAWGRIFRALPQARLRVQNASMGFADARVHFLERLRRAGIVADSVTLAGHAPRGEYLLAHAEVDIVLDTFPYCGATTTCEALWMGVPTLTLAGDTLVSRQGASLLASAGLDDWVASDEADYLTRATAFASDLERLARLRAGLREQVLASPLFDARRFARHLEEALRGMWEHKLNGRRPRGNSGATESNPDGAGLG